MTVAQRLRIIIPIAGVIGAVYLVTRGDAPTSHLFASGTVEATDADLGFQLPGRISAIDVDFGDPVTAGDRLAVLDLTQLQALHRSAEAQVAMAQARLEELETGFRRSAT